jgi:hypothetical protein
MGWLQKIFCGFLKLAYIYFPGLLSDCGLKKMNDAGIFKAHASSSQTSVIVQPELPPTPGMFTYTKNTYCLFPFFCSFFKLR